MSLGLAFGIFLASIVVAVTSVVLVTPLLLGVRLDELNEIWDDDE